MKEVNDYLEAARLIERYLKNELNPEESDRLKSWINEKDEHRDIWNRLTDPAQLENGMQYWKDHGDGEMYWNRLSAEISNKHNQKRRLLRRAMKYAAIIIPLLMVAGTARYLIVQGEHKNTIKKPSVLAENHLMPKGKVAQLILANGETVNLGEGPQKSITEQDGTKLYNQSSALSYTTGSHAGNPVTLYNQLITPRGGEYQVTLSDGTKVWLNAASSLRYPTQFNGKERKVYLSGEGYFEVAKNANLPFIVNTGNSDIRVLGTKFNVSAYPDDPVRKTTLAEGSVSVSLAEPDPTGSRPVLLAPGYEAVIKTNGREILVNKANLESVLAWKNGMFIFDGETLGSLMRKLSRWYNVDVEYGDETDTLLHFTGRIQRYENINSILHLIELTDKVKFILRSDKLLVSSNKTAR